MYSYISTTQNNYGFGDCLNMFILYTCIFFTITNTICFVLEIRLEFMGKARVHWSESHGSGKNRHTVHYTANEVYFNNVVSVFGKGNLNVQNITIRFVVSNTL